jgi:hypothetical protein
MGGLASVLLKILEEPYLSRQKGFAKTKPFGFYSRSKGFEVEDVGDASDASDV